MAEYGEQCLAAYFVGAGHFARPCEGDGLCRKIGRINVRAHCSSGLRVAQQTSGSFEHRVARRVVARRGVPPRPADCVR